MTTITKRNLIAKRGPGVWVVWPDAEVKESIRLFLIENNCDSGEDAVNELFEMTKEKASVNEETAIRNFAGNPPAEWIAKGNK